MYTDILSILIIKRLYKSILKYMYTDILSILIIKSIDNNAKPLNSFNNNSKQF